MAGEDQQRRSDIAMRQRDVGGSGRAKRGSDSGDNFEINAALSQGLDLFAASAEDEGIAALKPNHLQIEPGIVDQRLIYVLLQGTLPTAALANVF